MLQDFTYPSRKEYQGMVKHLMNALSLPISGGSFPFQLSVIRDLASIGWKPDITMATSGGNVAAYTAAAGDWNPEGINISASKLSSEVFTKSWSSSIPSYAIGIFRGCIYNSAAKEAVSFFRKNFDEKSVSKYEIWSGTTHIYERTAQMICNREKKNSILGSQNISSIDYGCREAMYMDSDVDLIALSSLASASIPALVPPVEIRGEILCDGGMLYASPLACLANSIATISTEKRKNLHITIISSRDMDLPPPNKNTFSGNYCTFDEECSKYRKCDLKKSKPNKSISKATYPQTEIKHLHDDGLARHYSSDSCVLQIDPPSYDPVRISKIGSPEVPPKRGNIASSSMMIASMFTAGNCRQDRLAALNLLKDVTKSKINFLMCGCNSTIISDIEKARLLSNGSLVEYFPLWEIGVCMTSFKGKDVLSVMKRTDLGYMARIWWSGNEDLFSKLKFE